MELLSARSILGVDLLGPAAARSFSLDSAVTAADIRAICTRGGLDQGPVRADSCATVPDVDDAYHNASHHALLYEQAVGAVPLDRIDVLLKDKLAGGDY